MCLQYLRSHIQRVEFEAEVVGTKEAADFSAEEEVGLEASPESSSMLLHL